MPPVSFLFTLIALAGLLAVDSPTDDASGDPPVLDIDRLFEEPDLNGPAPSDIRISPDGTRVTYLRASDDDRSRFDLWEFRPESGENRLLVDSSTLVTGGEELSEEEQARRERQRIAWRRGIVSYAFSPDGSSLLFPLGGDLYLYRIEDAELRRLTETAAGETDPKFSPGGRYVSFIRNQDLFVIDLADGAERRLTTDGGGVIKNGMAEFIAQEEMDRDTGYWWAPDESAIAFARVDESPVQIARRFEIYAEETRVIDQRYPATGTPNVDIGLGVVTLADGAVRMLDLGDDEDIYLARVDWFPDSRNLAVQRQSRDQRRLDLLRFHTGTGDSTLLVTETSDTWLDLYDELTFIDGGERFLWPSARDGYKHLYLYQADGTLSHQITRGDWEVTGERYKRAVLHVDESAGLVYFQATRESPLERHVYVTALDGSGEPKRLTAEPGWHLATFAEDGSLFVDRFESPETPPQVSVHGPDGRRIGFIEENRLDESHPYFPYLAQHSPPEFGELTAADGQTLYFRMNKPADFDPDRRYPAIVLVYGGPHGQRVIRDWYGLPLEQILTRRGYVVFQLDNRGTGFRGVAFDAPIHRRLGRVEVDDQLVGLAYLKALPWVEPERIGMFGWSYGGYMTLMTLLQAPGAFAAGVSGAPVTDWRLYDTHYTERYLGMPRENPKGYEASGAFPYVPNLAAPLLVIHGMADDNVLFTHSTKLFEALQDADRPFDVMTYPGAKHGLLRQEAEGRHGYKMILRFFDSHLGPGQE